MSEQIILVPRDELTVEVFNETMIARGCPIRVDYSSNANAALLAAWNWLALKTEQGK